MICSKCKTEIENSSKFCSSCGASTQVTCRFCHTSIKSNFSFCPNCGKSKHATFCIACENELEEVSNFCPYCGLKTEVNQTELRFKSCQETAESATRVVYKRTERAENKEDSCHSGDDAFQNPREDGHNTQDSAVTLHKTGVIDTYSTGVLQTIADTLTKRGITVEKDRIQRDLDFWKGCTIKIAVIGESGSGKSSLINTLLELNSCDIGAAAVGITETTVAMKCYPHPKHSNLEFWDLPGYGSSRFPKYTYLETVCVNQYDFFILTSTGRIKENDAWLAREIFALRKGFYFVRTMIDFAISKDKLTKGPKHNPDNVLDVIRSECIENLKKANVCDPHVFLVSNYDREKYDFNKLFTQLMDDVPESKKEALVLGYVTISPKVIEEKCKVLTNRIYKVALLFSAASAISIPGTGRVVDFELMRRETEFYREQLGTSDESLARIANHFSISLDDLKVQVNIESPLYFKSETAFINMFAGLVISELIEDTAKALFPIMGSIIAMVTTYPTSVFIQKHLLNICANEAYRVMQFKPRYLD